MYVPMYCLPWTLPDPDPAIERTHPNRCKINGLPLHLSQVLPTTSKLG